MEQKTAEKELMKLKAIVQTDLFALLWEELRFDGVSYVS